jgi:hypothetical protein
MSVRDRFRDIRDRSRDTESDDRDGESEEASSSQEGGGVVDSVTDTVTDAFRNLTGGGGGSGDGAGQPSGGDGGSQNVVDETIDRIQRGEDPLVGSGGASGTDSPTGESVTEGFRDAGAADGDTRVESRSGGSGQEVTDRQQQEIDAALSEEVRGVRREQQGVERAGGRVGEQAGRLESRVLDENPQLDAADVRVNRQGDTLQAGLTDTGREAFGANPTRQEVRQQFAEQTGLPPSSIDVTFDDGSATATTEVSTPSVSPPSVPDTPDVLREIEEATPFNFGTGGGARPPPQDLTDLSSEQRRRLSGEFDASQGVEAGDGPLAAQARDLEQQVLQENPELRPQDVAVRQGDGELQADLTQGGREYARAVALLEQDNRTAGTGPQDFGDRFVPSSVEQPADDFAAFVERGVSGGLQGTPGVQSTILVPTEDGLAAPGIGGEPNAVEQGVAEGAGDFVTGAAELPSTAIQVGEAGTYVVGGTGLAGGSREKTLQRSEAVGERGLELAQQSAAFAQENPIRFGTSAGLGVLTGSALSRVAGGSRTGLASSTRRTAGTYGSALPDVDVPDVDFSRTLRGDDRGMADFGRRSDQDVDTQEEAEVTVERGTEEAAEAERSVEEFMEREPANAAFRQENIPEGRGPSTPLAVERGLDDVTAEDFGIPTNVERTLLDRDAADLRERLPDPSEFESREAFETELELLRERVEAESDQTVTAEADTDQATTGAGRAGAEAEAGALASAEAGTLAAVALDTPSTGLEAEALAEPDTDTGLAVAPTVTSEQTTDMGLQQDVSVGLDTAAEIETGLTTDMEQELGQDLTLQLEQGLQTQVDQELQRDLTTTMEQELDQDLIQDFGQEAEQDLLLDTSGTPQQLELAFGPNRNEEDELFRGFREEEATFSSGIADADEFLSGGSDTDLFGGATDPFDGDQDVFGR